MIENMSHCAKKRKWLARKVRGNRHRARAAWILLAACLIPVMGRPAWSADETDFVLSKLSVADKLLDLQAEDLNADGLKDIMIIHRKGLPPKETRWISIFWQGQRGDFSTAADQSWSLDTTAVVLDIGDIAGGAEKEICYLTPDEVRYYSLAEGSYQLEPRTLFKAGGLTVFPSKQSIPIINFVRDWDSDGRDEVGIFRFEGLSIHSPDSTGTFSTENPLMIELDTGMSRDREDSGGGSDTQTAGLRARFTFPDIELVDYDNDGRKDLIATTEDRVIVYRQAEDHTFSTHPHNDMLFDVRTQHEKIEGHAELHTSVTDLNGDGFADAVVTKQTNKGLSNFRGVINIFYGTPNGYAGKPDQVIISEGTASTRTYIRDVNGDERLDLVLPSIKISVTSIIRWLITRSIPINFNIFLLKPDGRFSDQPDLTKEVKFKIDWSGESDSQAMDLDGDYNGDKRKDFVFATDENELSIYLGEADEKNRLFSKKPIAKVSADAYGMLFSPDLNGDGYSDMVIWYPQSKERKGMVQVLINQRRLK